MTNHFILPDIAAHLKRDSKKYRFEVIGQPNPHLVTFRETRMTEGRVELAYLTRMSLPHFHPNTDSVFYPLNSSLMLYGHSSSLANSTGDSSFYEAELKLIEPFKFYDAPRGGIHSFGSSSDGQVLALLIYNSEYRERSEEYPNETIFCNDLMVQHGVMESKYVNWFREQTKDWKINIYRSNR